MSNCTIVSIDAYKGTTVKSPNFFDIEEIIPPHSNIADIEDGLLTGKYTASDPNLYTYVAQVRTGYGQALIHQLDISIETETIDGEVDGGVGEYSVVTFKIPPAVTNTWDNREHSLLFDIKRTLIEDPTEVDIWVKGNINVLPTITE